MPGTASNLAVTFQNKISERELDDLSAVVYLLQIAYGADMPVFKPLLESNLNL